MNGREEGGMGKERTQKILEQGSDIGGHLLYFHMCKIGHSLGS